MEKAVEHGAGGGGVTEQLAPVLDGSVGADHGGADLVAAGEDLEETLGPRRRQTEPSAGLADQQVSAGEPVHQLLASAQRRRFGEVLGEVEGGAVEDGVPGMDGGQRQAQADVALAEPGRADEKNAAPFGDKAGRGQVDDQRLGQTGLKLQSKLSSV